MTLTAQSSADERRRRWNYPIDNPGLPVLAEALLSGRALPKPAMARRYYNLPSLTALAAFEASARHVSFKDAARELNVTPGAVSRQIKSLEEEAGRALFERVHRGVVLTSAGEELFNVLSISFGQWSDVFERISAPNKNPSVTVGATTAFASLWLMPRLGSFWQSHQNITINHIISDSAEELRHPNVELRVRYGAGQWAGEKVQKLFDDVIYPVCGPKFADQHREVAPSGLSGLPLLDMHGLDAEWLVWNGWFDRAGLPRPTTQARRFNNYVIALQAARENQGVALGWHSQVKPLIDAGKLVRLTKAAIPAPGAFYVTWDANRSLSHAALTLREWLSGEVAVR